LRRTLAHHAHAARRIVGACALVVALGLTACGSDSSSSSNASQAQQQRRNGGPGAFLQDAKVRACLQKQGVTVPTFGRPQNGQPPSGQRRNRDSAQLEKLRAALQKCGVTLLQGGGPGGPPPNQGTGTTTSSAS
jgi:hypothetical protein